MKILALFLTLFVSVSAQARSIKYTQEVTLKTVAINGEVQPKHVAIVTLNFHERIINVAIYNDHCNHYNRKPGQVTCMAMPSMVAHFQAPIVKKYSDCGSYYYDAESFKSRVDGLDVEIRAADDSRRTCDHMTPASDFTVDATVYNPRKNARTSYHME